MSNSVPQQLDDRIQHISVAKTGFLAYIDMLGYSDYLKNAEDDSQFYASVMSAVKFAKEIEEQPEGYVTKAFSDNVLIAPSENNDEDDNMCVLDLVTFVAYAHILMLVDEGILLRGSIVYDNVLLDEDVVFGRGIVTAHDAERSAVYPRTVIHDSVLEKIGDVVERVPMVKLDSDGKWYVDYFAAIEGLVSERGDGDPSEEDILRRVCQNLEGRVRRYCKFPANVARPETIAARESVIAKHLWVLSKFNKYCESRGHPDCAVGYQIIVNERLFKPELSLVPR